MKGTTSLAQDLTKQFWDQVTFIILKTFYLFRAYVLNSGANTAKMYEDGWRGLLLDAENENLEINLRKHYIFQNNILSIFKQYSVPIEMDYLSVDMGKKTVLYTMCIH